MQHGYAMIDLGTLHSMKVKDIYLAKFASLVVQFISQRHRPVRGNGLKLLMSYLGTFPCKTCLTVAGCYLCPAPGSKGSKVLICYSIDTSLPPVIKSCHNSYTWQNCFVTDELEQIVRKAKSNTDNFVPDASTVPFLDATSSESVLIEAKRLGILSDISHKTIVSLQKQESEKFKPTTEPITDSESKDNIKSPGPTLYPGQLGYFMNRFLLHWKVCEESQCFCNRCIIDDQMVAAVRYMIDADWIHLYDLSKKTNLADIETEQLSGKTMDHAILSACRALVSLKSIPVAARRSMPVLVNSEGVLLSIPSIGFSHCPHLMVSAVFRPRIPLGGGHSSFS